MSRLPCAMSGGNLYPVTMSWRTTWSARGCRRYTTFAASLFQHHWEDVGLTAYPYNWHPLALLNTARRGAVIEKWARQKLQESNPKCLVEDAVPGICVDGRQRSWNMAEYDFRCDGRKVEVKSAQLSQGVHGKRWRVRFQRIDFQQPAFDDLYLVIFSPKWLHLVKHDLQTAMSNSGREVRVFGKHRAWEDSLDLILDKLCTIGHCQLIGKIETSDSWIAAECEQHAGCTTPYYCGRPFASMSPQLRGFRIERLLREVDQLLHPEMIWSRPSSDLQHHSHMADWIRGETRVEAKSSQLSLSSAKKWYCEFHGVKPGSFDELLLAIYSPIGIDIFRRDGETQQESVHFRVSASGGELNPLRALHQIEEKLTERNCRKVARIPWDA